MKTSSYAKMGDGDYGSEKDTHRKSFCESSTSEFSSMKTKKQDPSGQKGCMLSRALSFTESIKDKKKFFNNTTSTSSSPPMRTFSMRRSSVPNSVIGHDSTPSACAFKRSGSYSYSRIAPDFVEDDPMDSNDDMANKKKKKKRGAVLRTCKRLLGMNKHNSHHRV